MIIKKVNQTTPIQAQVIDGPSDSQTNPYSANYVNSVIGDKLPIGTKMEYNGSSEDIPDGWQIVSGYGRELCKITLQTDNTTLTASSNYDGVKVPLTTYYNTSSRLSVTNNQIVIGAGVHHIKVSANMIQDKNSDLGLRGIQVKKNGNTEMISNYSVAYVTNEFHTYTIPESYFHTQEGDTIGLYHYINNNGATSRIRMYGQSTFLQVEIID